MIEIEADRYMSTHLYGAIAEVHNADVSIEDASDIFNTSARSLLLDISASNTFEKKKWIHEQEINQVKQKMSPKETYVALLKGYCAITILMMPKAFLNGGWAVSAAM